MASAASKRSLARAVRAAVPKPGNPRIQPETPRLPVKRANHIVEAEAQIRAGRFDGLGRIQALQRSPESVGDMPDAPRAERRSVRVRFERVKVEDLAKPRKRRAIELCRLQKALPFSMAKVPNGA